MIKIHKITRTPHMENTSIEVSCVQLTPLPFHSPFLKSIVIPNFCGVDVHPHIKNINQEGLNIHTDHDFWAVPEGSTCFSALAVVAVRAALCVAAASAKAPGAQEGLMASPRCPVN